MLSEFEIKDKIRKRAEQVTQYYRQRKYITSKGIYNQLIDVSYFIGLDQDFLEEVFGGYNEKIDDYQPGIIDKRLIQKANQKCCELRNKEYEDRAMRRAGEPIRYYSDITYCAICEKNKEP